MTAMTPYFTVVIAAQDRRAFIEHALASVLNQSIDRRLVEIIIVTNFDFETNAKDIIVLRCDDSRTGAKLAMGLKRSSGSVIAPLDDDDTWRYNRLSRIYSFLSKDENIIYYHNEAATMDEGGTLKGQTDNIVGGVQEYRGDADFVEIRKMHQMRADWNSSSLAFRRDILSNKLDSLEQIARSPEIFFFYSSLLPGKKLLLDSSILTNYRVHPLNTSTVPKSGRQKIEDLNSNFKTHLQDCLILKETLNLGNGGVDRTRALNRTILDDEIHLFLTGEAVAPSQRLKTALTYTKFISRSFFRYDAGIVMAALMSGISTKAGISIYMRRFEEGS